MAVKDGLRFLLLFLIAACLPLLIWEGARAYTGITTYHQGLTWAFGGSAIPIAFANYLLTRRFRRRYPVLPPAIVVGASTAATLVAAIIAVTTGALANATALTAPFLGASLGWQLAGGLQPPKKATRRSPNGGPVRAAEAGMLRPWREPPEL